MRRDLARYQQQERDHVDREAPAEMAEEFDGDDRCQRRRGGVDPIVANQNDHQRANQLSARPRDCECVLDHRSHQVWPV